MTGERLQIIYGLNVVTPLEAWEAIFDYLLKEGVPSTTLVKFSGKEISLGSVYENIYKSENKHFRIALDDMLIDYGVVTAWKHVLVSVKSQSSHCEWDKLISNFLGKAIFIQAWISDNTYNFWQNATDPLQYKAYGKSFSELPIKSNNLPPPLEQVEIDISANPGRRIIKKGYIEAIGHHMWLGPEFFHRVPNIQREVLFTQPWLQVIELENDVLELIVLDTPFIDESTHEIQNQLRSLLFCDKQDR